MLVDQDLQDEIRLATRFFQKKNLFPVLQVKLYEKSAGADASLLNGSTDIKKKFGDLEGN